MNKQTKNILTRNFIEDELRFLNKADLRSATVMCACFAPICILMALLMFFATKQFNNTFFKIICTIIFTLAPLAPVIAMVCSIYSSLHDAKLLERGEYDIVSRELSYKSEEYRHHGKRGEFVEMLHFPGFKPMEVDHVTYELAEADEVFYFVVYRKKNAQPTLSYSSKMYELTDKEILL